MSTTVTSALGIILILMPVVARLGELLLRQWALVRIERARQLAALQTIMMMYPGSLVVVQQPDGTMSVLVRTPVVDGGSGTTMRSG